MNFKPSTYQSAIYNQLSNTTTNIVVNAVAGSGKSTTIVNSLSYIPLDKKVLFLAFNKSIKEELDIKLKDFNNVTVKTLHSLGFSSIVRTFKTKLNNSKYVKYVYDSIKYGKISPNFQLTQNEALDYRKTIIKLVDLGRCFNANSISDMQIICDKYLIEIIDNEIDVALETISWGLDNTFEIDFTDMIYFPVAKNLKMSQYDYVFIDEAQDLNTTQRLLFLSTLNKNGRFIAVGDPQQAIYGFAGADIESFNELSKLPNTVSLPLSVCYRCDSSIIELSKTIVPQIEARPNASKGIVCDSLMKDIQSNDMVLCRLTAPLVGLCMQLISEGKKANVQGRDIGTNLINLLEKTNSIDISNAFDIINIDLNKLAIKIAKKSHISLEEAHQSSLCQSLSDKINALYCISDGLKTVKEVVNRINMIFSDNINGILLSTVHKAKGLEANNVYIIHNDAFMLKYAMNTTWGYEQEKNLIYVAYTRAKNKLGFITDYRFKRD